ncbi:MAG: hypothetical protein WBF06_06085 [Candidatus Acidiferrales bacterium]
MLRRWILLLGVASVALVGGCNDFNTTLGTPQNSTTISFLSPAGGNVGGSAFTLTVEGGTFLSNSVVEWNNTPRVTTYISGNILLAQINASDLATAGSASVLVYTPGTAMSDPDQGENIIATSNVIQFVVQAASAPLPVITSVSPATETAGGPAFTLKVFGTGFLQPATNCALQTTGSMVYWNGSEVTETQNTPTCMATTTATTFVSSTEVDVAVPASFIATSQTARITVFNPPTGSPATGGGSSNTWPLSVSGGGGGNARAEALAQAEASSAATSLSPAISTDARYVAFVGPVPDPTTNASTGTDNVYVRDTCTGAPSGCTQTTTLISVAADGVSAADGESESPSMSADGRYVTFVSYADNLVAAGASGLGDIFVRDTCTGAPAASSCTPTTTLITAAPDGSFENGASDSPSISASGRYIVFSSLATNLVAGTATTSSGPEIYLRDLCVGAPAGCQATTIQLSVSSSTSSPSSTDSGP